MIAGPPALCRGQVWHRRNLPTRHTFSYDVTYVWFDPDHPETITDHHWAWSNRRLRPVIIRSDDYGFGEPGSTSASVRRRLATVIPSTAVGPVRLLTQPRRWGWLFNPISVYLAWPSNGNDGNESYDGSSEVPRGGPSGAVLEVTNTPWKERHHYALALTRGESPAATPVYEATFAKALHVSPFLPADLTYNLRIGEQSAEVPTAGLSVELSVMDQSGRQILETGMALQRLPVTTSALAHSLRHDRFPTHRVSSGIHHQAARLLAKRIPFVPHPKRSTGHGHTGH